MPEDMEARPSQPIGQFQAVGRHLRQAVIAPHAHRAAVTAQIDEGVGEGSAIKPGQQRRVATVVAQPVVQHHDASRAVAVQHMTQATLGRCVGIG